MTRPHQPEPLPTVPHACAAAQQAFAVWASYPPKDRASVLRALAHALDMAWSDIFDTAEPESGLRQNDELVSELGRMTGTLRRFSDAIERGSWCLPVIDTLANGSHSIEAHRDIRRTLVPLGPVAVFGASNFPLAYGVCGGDTASALAAGCTVVVKEHPAHPKTGRLLFTIAATALERASGIAGLLNYVANEDPKDFSIAKLLVQHDAIAAVGFTGSIAGGTAIEQLAREREHPIPAFCEMGSTNPVFITARAARERGAAIGAMIADSLILRYGQQCTCPGMVIVDSAGYQPQSSGWGKERQSRDGYEAVVSILRQRIGSTPERDMLSPDVRASYRARVLELLACWKDAPEQPRVTGVVDDHFTRPMLFEIDEIDIRMGGRTFAEEVFGPACVATSLDFTIDGAMRELLDVFGGQLTASIFHEGADDPGLAVVLPLAQRLAGRVIFNGVPTGVRVAHAMVHSGPFPSCNRPDTTAVGPLALQRWCRPICYQNCPDALLPPELKDANPRGLMRIVNGEYTREPLPAAH